MPGDDRFGSDDDERRSPVFPHTRQPGPEQAVGPAETQAPSTRTLQNLKLVPQREQLKLQGGP